MSSLNGSAVVPIRPATTGADRVRTGALLAATAAQVLVPVIGPLFGQSEIAEVSKRTKSIVTPPDWAFAVWGPIFTGSAATAVVQALPGRPVLGLLVLPGQSEQQGVLVLQDRLVQEPPDRPA